MTNSAHTLAVPVGIRVGGMAPARGATTYGSHDCDRVLKRDRADLQTAFVQLLADTLTLRDLYAKHAEQAFGPHARVFQLICQRHRVEHARLADLLSAQVRALGGDGLIMAGDIADTTRIPRPPRRRETLDVKVQRLMNAHEIISGQAVALPTSPDIAAISGPASREAVLVASDLILTGKLHVWLLVEHLRNVSHASDVGAHMVYISGRLVLPSC